MSLDLRQKPEKFQVKSKTQNVNSRIFSNLILHVVKWFVNNKLAFAFYCSWTWRRIHRLCGHTVVSLSWTAGGRHTVWITSWHMGHRYVEKKVLSVFETPWRRSKQKRKHNCKSTKASLPIKSVTHFHGIWPPKWMWAWLRLHCAQRLHVNHSQVSTEHVVQAYLTCHSLFLSLSLSLFLSYTRINSNRQIQQSKKRRER